MEPKPSKFLKWALVLGLVVVLNLFFNYSIHLLYKGPIFENFCQQKQVTIQPKTQAECLVQKGTWIENANYRAPSPAMIKPSPAEPVVTEPVGWCDLNFTCNKDFKNAEALYNRNGFIILIVLGVVSLIIGFVTVVAPAVSIGFSLGGVLSFIVGSIRYWSDMDDYLRVIILALALAILIWLGVKKLRE
jgi:hypothetical protein